MPNGSFDESFEAIRSKPKKRKFFLVTKPGKRLDTNSTDEESADSKPCEVVIRSQHRSKRRHKRQKPKTADDPTKSIIDKTHDSVLTKDLNSDICFDGAQMSTFLAKKPSMEEISPVEP